MSLGFRPIQPFRFFGVRDEEPAVLLSYIPTLHTERLIPYSLTTETG